MQGTRIDGMVLVIEARLSVNLNALTIEHAAAHASARQRDVSFSFSSLCAVCFWVRLHQTIAARQPAVTISNS